MKSKQKGSSGMLAFFYGMLVDCAKERPPRVATSYLLLLGGRDGVPGEGHADVGGRFVLSVVVEVDIREELRLGRGLGGLGALPGGLDVGPGLEADGLEFVFGGDGVVEGDVFGNLQGVEERPHALDFFALAVGQAGVGGGVAVEAVGGELEVDGSAAGGGVFLGELGGFPDGEDVLAVDADPRDEVAHGIIVGVARGPLRRRAHAVVVVFDAEDHRQLPEHGHVRRFGDLALVRRAVAVAGNGHGHRRPRRRLVLVREGQAYE
mmetsp:Transcript_19479/g.62536  ORF Transcript_19479/g.62536 Transcript_19479/m.62536 type:complete len:264 (-) Transcript_19479:693-1484(-)